MWCWGRAQQSPPANSAVPRLSFVFFFACVFCFSVMGHQPPPKNGLGENPRPPRATSVPALALSRPHFSHIGGGVAARELGVWVVYLRVCVCCQSASRPSFFFPFSCLALMGPFIMGDDPSPKHMHPLCMHTAVALPSPPVFPATLCVRRVVQATRVGDGGRWQVVISTGVWGRLVGDTVSWGLEGTSRWPKTAQSPHGSLSNPWLSLAPLASMPPVPSS